MTNREFLSAVVAGSFTDEVVEFARNSLTALDTKNAKRKVSPSALKAQAERDAFRALVLSALTDAFQSSAEVAAVVGESVPKTAAALTALVKAGKVVAEPFKPAGAKRKTNGYRLAPAPDEGEGELDEFEDVEDEDVGEFDENEGAE